VSLRASQPWHTLRNYPAPNIARQSYAHKQSNAFYMDIWFLSCLFLSHNLAVMFVPLRPSGWPVNVCALLWHAPRPQTPDYSNKGSIMVTRNASSTLKSVCTLVDTHVCLCTREGGSTQVAKMLREAHLIPMYIYFMRVSCTYSVQHTVEGDCLQVPCYPSCYVDIVDTDTCRQRAKHGYP
jgi:hypothetical protein